MDGNDVKSLKNVVTTLFWRRVPAGKNASHTATLPFNLSIKENQQKKKNDKEYQRKNIQILLEIFYHRQF